MENIKKEFGFKAFANSKIVLKNGAILYVEDPIETIEERMKDKNKTIHLTVAAIVRDVFRIIEKESIARFVKVI